jgi:hypothetical protein
LIDAGVALINHAAPSTTIGRKCHFSEYGAEGAFLDGYVATADDVEKELNRIGHTLSPLEIVVVN